MKTKALNNFISSNAKALVVAIALLGTQVAMAEGFTTKPTADTTAPAISSLKMEEIKGTSATISWITDEITNTHIRIFKEGTLDKVKGDLEYESNHTVVLTKLEPLTSYDITVTSTDLSKNSTTTELTFETVEDVPEPPETNTDFIPAVIMYLLN